MLTFPRHYDLTLLSQHLCNFWCNVPHFPTCLPFIPCAFVSLITNLLRSSYFSCKLEIYNTSCDCITRICICLPSLAFSYLNRACTENIQIHHCAQQSRRNMTHCPGLPRRSTLINARLPLPTAYIPAPLLFCFSIYEPFALQALCALNSLSGTEYENRNTQTNLIPFDAFRRSPLFLYLAFKAVK